VDDPIDIGWDSNNILKFRVNLTQFYNIIFKWKLPILKNSCLGYLIFEMKLSTMSSNGSHITYFYFKMINVSTISELN
jgi:hypothetical protein